METTIEHGRIGLVKESSLLSFLIVAANGIRAIVSPDPTPTTNHRKLYKVIEVWSVDKR